MNTHILVEGGTCQLLPSATEQNTKYFYRNPQADTGTTPPTINPNDVTLSTFAIDKEGTVCFFIKIIGFLTADADVVRYGTGLKLYYISDMAKYNSVGYDKYGLSLLNTSTATYESLANDKSFRDYIGKWVFISLAYYYDPAVAANYPPMLHFMINENVLQINSAAALTGYDIKNFVLPKTTYCLFAKLTVFYKYLVGAYGLVNNPTDFAAISSTIYKQYFLPGSSVNNCVITSDLSGYWAVTVTCYADYNQNFFPTTCATQNFLKSGVQTACLLKSGLKACASGCYYNTNDGYNNNNYSCWCFMNNSYTSMYLRNDYKFACYRK